MANKKDKAILKLLKEKVIEKDKEIERKSYHSATKEALAELTSLSQSEVDSIYRNVKAEVDQKYRRKRKYIIWITLLVLVAGVIAFFAVRESLREPNKFIETFDDNSYGWSFDDIVGPGHYLTNGEFIIDAQKDPTYIEYIDHQMDLPENFSIEAEARKLDGDSESYGIYLGQDDDNFGYFFIRSAGTFRCGFSVGGKWQDNPDWEKHRAINRKPKEINKLRVQVKGNSYAFFVNDELLRRGNMHHLLCQKYSLAAGGNQVIAFDNLKLINTDTGEIIYANTFDEPDEPWVPKDNMISRGEIKDGNYYILSNKDDYCYWAKAWMPAVFSEDVPDFEVVLKAEILERQGDAGLGFMWMEDDENYFSFETENGKRARAVVKTGEGYEYVGDYSSDLEEPAKTVEIKIIREGDKIDYYFNGRLIDKLKIDEWFYVSDMDRIGLRVCDRQAVSFQELRIKEIK